MITKQSIHGCWQWLSTLLLALLALASGIHIFLILDHTIARGSFADTPIFVENARDFLRTGDLYDLTPPLEVTFSPAAWIYKFPPLYSLPYLLWVDPALPANDDIYVIFLLWHVMRYFAVLLLCVRLFGPQDDLRWGLLLFVVFVAFAPWIESLFGLTFDNLLLLVLASVLALLQSRWRMHTAWLLSYVSLAKLFPVTQLLVLIGSRDNRNILWRCVVAGLLWLCLSVLAFGMPNHVAYYGAILPVLLGEEISDLPNNMSLLAKWVAATGLPAISWSLPILLASVVMVLWSSRRLVQLPAPQDREEMARLQFAFIVPVMLLILKNIWGNYQLVLLLPFAIILGGAWRSQGVLRWLRWLLCTAAMFPQLATVNYQPLELGYINELISGREGLFFSMIRWRHYSPLVLWFGAGFLLFFELRAAQRKNQMR